MAVSTQLTSMLGIYLVAAELTSRDFIIATTPMSIQGVDLMATDQRCRRAWTVQVLTNRMAANTWPLDARKKEIVSESHIYIFTNLRGDKRPYYYVVPSRLVAQEMHADRNGQGGYEFRREMADAHRENWLLFGPPT